MLKFKLIHHGRHNILIVTENNELFIIGDNYRDKSGIMTNSLCISTPMSLGIKLDDGESIKSFMANLGNIFIHTDQNRLIIPCHNSIKHDPIHLPDAKPYCSLDIDPERPVQLIRETSALIKKDFDPDTSIGTHVKEMREESSDVDPTPSQIKSWIPLKQELFTILDPESQRLYQKCAAIRIQQDMARDAEWCKNNEIVELVFKQIDTPIIFPFAAETLKPYVVKKPSLIISGYIQGNPPTSVESSSDPMHTAWMEYTSSADLQPIQRCNFKRKFIDNNPVIMIDVDDIVYGVDANIYVMGDKMIVEMFNCREDSWGIYDVSLPIKIFGNQANCYEIMYPFVCDQKIITRDFVFIREKVGDNYRYHIIVPCALERSPVSWITFVADFEVDAKRVHWQFSTLAIYILNDDAIYCYERSSQCLRKVIDRNAIMVFTSYSNFYWDIEFVNEFGTYIRGNFTCLGGIEMSNYPPPSNAIQNPYVSMIKSFHQALDGSQICYFALYEKPEAQRLTVFQNMPYINMLDVKYYGDMHWGCFVFILDMELHIICRRELGLKVISNSEKVSHYVIKMPFSESEIIKCEINGFALIETKDAYYCTYANFDFQFKKFPKEGIFLSRNIPLNLIDRTAKLLLYDKFRTTSILRIEINNKYVSPFDQFLDFATKIALGPHAFRASYNGYAASSDGSRIIAVEAALRDFASKYLVKYNFVTTFNLMALKCCSNAELNSIGKALAMMFINLDNALSIHLPLLLLAAIYRCSLTTAEFEFFAHQEDPDAFASLHAIKDAKDKLQEAGFDDYLQGLKTICYFDIYPKETDRRYAYYCAREIANGFLIDITIKNAFSMNFPTLDWCLSGAYVINIPEFLANQVKYSNISNVQKSMFTNYVSGLTSENFRKLLRNWSGTSAYKKNIYEVQVESSSSTNIVSFATCSHKISINEAAFDHYECAYWDIFFLDECMYLQG